MKTPFLIVLSEKQFIKLFAIFPALIFTALLTTSCAKAQDAASETLHLAANGKTSYVIALADDAIPAEKTAAEQLQKYFQEMTGATISIQPENKVSDDAPQILIGNGERAKVLLSGIDLEKLGGDGIVIKTVGDKLILAGDRPRGSLYAVFQFLEAQGCRWWTPKARDIPRKSTFDVVPQNTIYTPQIKFRQHKSIAVQDDPVFATIMRENGQSQRQKEDWGGHSTIIGWVHTFQKLLPVEKYFSQHPEWYSDPANGFKPATADSRQPGAQTTQLCFSSPGVVDEISKQALALIEKNPDAGYISISQNDNKNGYCRDEESLDLIKKEGSPSAPLIQFVNKVAAKINEKYPDFKVTTLAYNYSAKPPKTVRPAKNVIVRLAPISMDYGRPLDSEQNKSAMDALQGWAKAAPELFIWNYVTNFHYTMMPHPNWAGIGKDLRTFAANNVSGIYEQGDAYTNDVGDFNQLRTWLIAHLMWNPQLDQEQLTDEFLHGYYGEAAPFLKQYLELIETSFQSQNRKLTTYNDDFSFISPDVANQALQLFDKAEAAVKDNADQLRRVKRERLSLKIGILYQYRELEKTAQEENTQLAWPKDPVAAMDQFIADAQKAGVKNWSEGTKFSDQIPYLKNIVAPPIPLPDWAQKYPAEDVVDIQSSLLHLGRPEGRMQEDSDASGGTAATIVGSTNRWAIQTRFMPDIRNLPTGKWHIYEVARIAIKKDAAQKGTAFATGLYDPNNKDLGFSKKFPVTDFADEKYQTIDLGVHEVKSGAYMWVAPAKNSAVDRVFVDRIILVRER